MDKNKLLVGLQIFIIGTICSIFAWNLKYPLQGIQQHRQADTLMAGYLYCQEDAPFTEPRISFRGSSEKGVTIGEFPVFSYLLGLHCKWSGQQWSDTFPKVISELSLLLSLLLWSLLFFKGNFRGQLSFISLGLSIPMMVSFLSIPIPDSFALLIYTLGVFITERRSETSYLSRALAIALITLGVLTRPYLIFLTPFIYVLFGRRIYLFSVIPSLVAYLYWYKAVVPKSELLNYYYVGMPPIRTMLQSFFPALIYGVYPVLRDQFSLVGALLLLSPQRLDRKYLFYSIGIVLACLFLRGQHILPHQYYLISATIIFLFLMTKKLSTLPASRAIMIQIVMFVAMAISEQHHWHQPKVDHLKLKEFVDRNSGPSDRVCTKNFGLSIGMYLAKRTGWSDEWPNFKPYEQEKVENPWPDYHCPEGELVIDKNDFIRK